MEFVKNPRGDRSEKADRLPKHKDRAAFSDFIGGCGIYIHARLGVPGARDVCERVSDKFWARPRVLRSPYIRLCGVLRRRTQPPRSIHLRSSVTAERRHPALPLTTAFQHLRSLAITAICAVSPPR